ncbi:nicotinamidase/pyrazinamidase [Pseudomonas nitritireducens]|uniref:nicotinamidase n=1 Tax=Pseudomonas nitroreducens TaxID=46680 RepID=A0A7W7KQ40_PSENT|nr:isochorismatase family protein [Pseudomonas nitritireducens]MBB4866837.1 nicotinamidase/pyrazinamidase [Pseudomonas nitritireducens]
MNTSTRIFDATASFDIDPQVGFTPLAPSELPVPGGDEIVGELNAMAALARLRVASKDAHTPTAPWVVETHAEMLQPTGLPNADLTWVSHCVPGTPGYEFIPGLPAELDYDFVVYKGVSPSLHPYGACFHDLADKLSTGVIEYLKAQGIKNVIVGGLAYDYCVKTTAVQLAKAEFNVIVNMAATRAIADNSAADATRELGNYPNIRLVASAADVAVALSAL